MKSPAALLLPLLIWGAQQSCDAAAAADSRHLDPIPPGLEIIAVSAPESPAKFSIDKVNGRVEYADDAAGEAARACLEPPRDRDPRLNAIVAVAGTVVAPFAATYAAIAAERNKLSPEQLSDSEANLVKAMALMADQKHLRERFREAASEKTRRHLIVSEPIASLPAHPDPAIAIVETRVEELRLERTGSSDTSYALLVKARARLVRSADGATLFDQPFQHRTGKGLFLDWSLEGVFQNVTETAYRKLAEQMVTQMFATPFDEPVLVGAGYKKSPSRPSDSSGMLVAHQPRRQVFAQFVNYPVGVAGPVGIFSTATPTPVTIQLPQTKTEAVEGAVQDVDWSLDGLQDSHHPLISATACVAAIPMSLWKQTVGAVQGLSKKKFQAAHAQLSSATQRARPHETVADQVALLLAPRTSQPAMLVNKPFPQAGAVEAGAAAFESRPKLVRSVPTSNSSKDRPGEVLDTVLHIQVLSVGLKGKDGINPRLALCVEAEATLWRVSDGRQLGSFSVHYRSAGRKFVDWAAQDARLFRQELEQCSRELGGAMVDQIAPPGLTLPERSPQPVLASNAK